MQLSFGFLHYGISRSYLLLKCYIPVHVVLGQSQSSCIKTDCSFRDYVPFSLEPGVGVYI